MGRGKKKISWSADGVDYAIRKGVKPKKLDQGPYWVFNVLFKAMIVGALLSLWFSSST